MKHNVRISRIMLQILLDRITLGCKMLFGALGGGGGRGGVDTGFQVTGVIEGFFVGWKFSIPGCFRLVFHLRGDFLRIQNNWKLSFLCYG